jgi:hypothetical protein
MTFYTYLQPTPSIAITKIVFEYRRDRRQRIDDTKYLALQLAFLFEGYAIECADKANDQRTADDSDGAAGSAIGRVPQLPPLPESDAYKLLDRARLNEVLDFPQRCQMANEAAMFWWDVVGDHDCCHNAMEENTLLMGGRAVDIAKKLRTTYGLDPRDLTFGKWNIEEFFSKELTKLDKIEQDRRQAEAVRSQRLAR